MEPRIQYAQTEDGVRIAYATAGKGEPVVWVQNPLASHVQLEWQQPTLRIFYAALAAKRMLIRYDTRGVGLSDREVDDLTFDGLVNDLEAVVDTLGLETFALLALEYGGMSAIPYAVRHPERVSRLILANSLAREADVAATPRFQALMGLAGDWEMFTENVGAVVFGFGREEARRYGKFIRACMSPETFSRFREAYAATDVGELLPKIGQPTLVIHHSGLEWHPMDTTRDLVARIPNARLFVVEGTYADNLERYVGAIDEFLDEGEVGETKTELPEGMAVILFADIVESTALTEQLGDAAFRDKARELDTSLRTIIRECSGTPVEGKVLGDGVLAVFTSARQAIECALRSNATSEPVGLQLHLGIHAGDVIREGNNVYGGAVNIAARIAGISAPGEVLVSDTVRSLARTSAGVTFDDRGDHELKGIEEPQGLFAVRDGADG